jgi:hypothetical protein
MRHLGERDFVVVDQHHVTHRKLRFGVRDTMSRHANVGEGAGAFYNNPFAATFYRSEGKE